MAECIENILRITAECMVPKGKPEFVACTLCTLSNIYEVIQFIFEYGML